MRHRDYSNPLPFRDELLQVFIPRMFYNYRIERQPYDEPAAMLFTSATRKSVIPPPPVRLSWDSRHPPPESVRTDGRAYADVRTKIFRINGLPNFLTHGAPRAPLKMLKLQFLDERGLWITLRDAKHNILRQN